MASARNCSMSEINSGHHNLTTYQRQMISDNVEFVAIILKMAIGRNFSMSGHHYLPTYQILMISDNVEFLPPIFLCRVLAAILKKFKMQNCSSNGDLSLCHILCLIIHLEVININVRNFNFPIGFYSNPHPLYHKAENFRTNQKHTSITPPSFMKFCPVVPEICRGQVHMSKKERKRIIRNGAKTISLQTLFGRLKYTHYHSSLTSFSN